MYPPLDFPDAFESSPVGTLLKCIPTCLVLVNCTCAQRRWLMKTILPVTLSLPSTTGELITHRSELLPLRSSSWGLAIGSTHHACPGFSVKLPVMSPAEPCCWGPQTKPNGSLTCSVRNLCFYLPRWFGSVSSLACLPEEEKCYACFGFSLFPQEHAGPTNTWMIIFLSKLILIPKFLFSFWYHPLLTGRADIKILYLRVLGSA